MGQDNISKDSQLQKYQQIQKNIMDLIIDVKEECQDYNEYKTIIMNLTTVSKELNSITLKHIVGSTDLDQTNHGKENN